ncbi:Glycosylphosphatidylinositol anchor attachment 1 protein [Orchesella cincta]|uniref:Glycosylphosphatidylinositol anchor attachment 1 protein n=1 Tax=Orchesella cincta TaxID=48709 RepID=A0A1D2MR21_ORCCI|nr:Glycosylphosphatidylinositol anchor attachment 1 protein [Orchesella cincta]
MGILTNPNTDDTNRLVKLLQGKGGAFGLICYLAGIAWLIFLANADYNLGTYFSENALLPGLVVENFDGAYYAEEFTKELFTLDAKYDGKIPPQEFEAFFHRLGLVETELQNYTISDLISKKKQDEGTGTNVFAVLRAKRAAGTESIVFNAPYFPKNRQSTRRNLAGIGIMFALADYFRHQVYWAKDIVFLISEAHLGSLAWVKGHQEITDDWSSSVFRFDNVHTKAGNIQAAVNFIMEGTDVCSLQSKFHGINGQLPNLDLVNLLNKFIVLDHEKRPDWPEVDVKKLFSFMQMQSTGTPSGSHGFFLKYGIESVTLLGKTSKNCRARNPVSYSDIGRILEATFRSLNNLLERLHQSFFFYLKTTPNRFISIGLYFPPIALILFPIALKAATIWLSKQGLNTTRGLFTLMGLHAYAIFLRWVLNNLNWILLPFLSAISPGVEIEIKSNVFACICGGLLMSILTFSLFLHWNVEKEIREAIYCFCLLELATGLYCLALFNPSLVVFIGVIVSPLVTFLFFVDMPEKQRYWAKALLLSIFVGVAYDWLGLDGLIYFVNKYYYESEVYGNFLFELGWIGGGVLILGVMIGGLI